MSIIYLIRHGQASFSKRDYDQLSERGITQATVLGKALKERKNTLSYFVGGTMKRHHETAKYATKELGITIDYVENNCWDEYDHMDLILKHRSDLHNFDQLMKYVTTQSNPMKAFQVLLNDAIHDWMEDKHDYITKWSDFKTQAWSGLNELAKRLNKGENALVFTSGGPISAIMLQLLNIKDTQFLGLQGKIVNSSSTKILVGKSGLSLSTYNDYSHLESESNLITYR